MRTEDGYIIDKCLNGEKAAFGFLVDKYKESVYAFAWDMLNDFHDAEDITQEVFIRVYRKLHTLRRWDNFLIWLRSITYNLCKDLIRKRAKRPDREFIEEQDKEAIEISNSIDSYQERLRHESLHEALDSLPKMYREVLTLHYFGGMKCKEIAQFLGKPISTIRQHLSRARGKLKKEMLDNMSATFEQQGLQSGFTFRIVEMVKQIKINPTPHTPGLPFGLSAATGVILAVLMFTTYPILLAPFGILSGTPMHSETKVEDVGELPVDVLELSEITSLSGERGDDNDGGKELLNPDVGASQVQSNTSSSLEKGKWTKKADVPFPVVGNNSACVVNGKIYVFWYGAFCEYDPSKDKWTKKKFDNLDLLTKKAQPSCCAVNGKIYVIFGSTVKEYNPATDKWTKKADMPTARFNLITGVVNGKIYAIGGDWPHKKASCSAIEEYDPRTDKWTKKSNMPKGMYATSGSAMGGKIYVIAGSLNDKRGIGYGFNHSSVLEYDPVTDTWTEKTGIPKWISGLSTCVLNGKVYAIGGYKKTSREFQPFSIVAEYHPATDTWRKSGMPTARAYLSASVVNGRIYAIGGLVFDPDTKKKVTTIVEEYDPEPEVF